MSELTINQKLESLEKRLVSLISAYEELKNANGELKKENDGLKTTSEQLRSQLADFQNKDKISKIANGTIVEKQDASELKNQLNEYIKEIDRCIDHLS